MIVEEFLEARIEDDERTADRHEGEWYGSARVLAECKLKRELLKISDFYTTTVGTEITRAMVMLYVDHPDCLHEWWQ